jgi:hypothetical protein
MNMGLPILYVEGPGHCFRRTGRLSWQDFHDSLRSSRQILRQCLQIGHDHIVSRSNVWYVLLLCCIACAVVRALMTKLKMGTNGTGRLMPNANMALHMLLWLIEQIDVTLLSNDCWKNVYKCFLAEYQCVNLRQTYRVIPRILFMRFVVDLRLVPESTALGCELCSAFPLCLRSCDFSCYSEGCRKWSVIDIFNTKRPLMLAYWLMGLYKEVLNFLDRFAACALCGGRCATGWESGASSADESVVRRPTKLGMK